MEVTLPESGAAPYADVGAVTPKLAQPWWYKHAHSGRFILVEERNRKPSPEAQRKIDQKARKADRRRKAGVGIAGLSAAVAAA